MARILRGRILLGGYTAIILALAFVPARADQLDLKQALAQLRAVGPKGVGHREAHAAWQKVVTANVDQLPQILEAMTDCGPLGENWLRAAAEAIAERHVQKGGQLPVPSLEAFLKQTRHSPRGRRLAYELIATVDSGAEQRLIPSLLNDPSLELRRDAVALELAKAETLAAGTDKEATLAAYRRAFQASRDMDQIKLATEKLRGLGSTVDLPSHMGFIMNWKVAAPFDNVKTRGFDLAYPPETGIDLQASYDGKGDRIGWVDLVTQDDYGNVDLNKLLDTYQRDDSDKPDVKKIRDQYKGAVAYATAEFVSDKEQDVELRLGSTNANKVWLNGELLTSNHIYHSGRDVDQYVGRGHLKKGSNRILLKIAQNEQTEVWAQDWQFQLRVCDRIGTAILSQTRPDTKTAAAR